jgi:hypothetical protein
VLVTASRVVSSVGSSACGFVASLEFAILVGVENFGQPVRGWVSFISFVWLGACVVINPRVSRTWLTEYSFCKYTLVDVSRRL